MRLRIQVNIIRYTSHKMGNNIEYRATKSLKSSNNEPQNSTEYSNNGPHFKYANPCIMDYLALENANHPLVTSIAFPKHPKVQEPRITSHIRKRLGIDLRDTISSVVSNLQPQLLDKRTTKKKCIHELRATKHRCMSHKNLCKYPPQRINSEANLLTICSLKKNKQSCCLY